MKNYFENEIKLSPLQTKTNQFILNSYNRYFLLSVVLIHVRIKKISFSLKK